MTSATFTRSNKCNITSGPAFFRSLPKSFNSASAILENTTKLLFSCAEGECL